MANLIDQMNILKGLDDQTLGAELSRPSGAVPPYLVMSELSRRKDMRQRYAGQLAQQKPATTVLQDQLSGLAPPSGVAAGQGAPMPPMGGVGSSPSGPVGAPMPASMGINAAADPAPTGYRQGGIVHYANGGYVGDLSYWLDPTVQGAQVPDDVGTVDAGGMVPDVSAILPPGAGGIDAINVPSQAMDPALVAQLPVDSATPVYAGTSQAGAAPGQALPAAPGPTATSPYDTIAAQYQQILDSGKSDKNTAQALALIQAGAAMAAGTSPYALSNIGAGLSAGASSYAASLKDNQARQQAAMAGLSSVQRDKLAQQNTQFDQNISSQDLTLKQQAAAAAADPFSPQNTPQAARDAQIYNSMPENTPDEIAAKEAFKQFALPFSAQAAATKASNAEIIADGVHNGSIDPNMPGMYGTKPQVIAAMAAKYPGDNLVQMQQQAAAASRNIQSMNSTQQLRLRQQIGELAGANGQPGMLDKLQQVADDWNGSGYPPLNKVSLDLAMMGHLGGDALKKATQFQAELADVTPALAGVFSSGNAPTDKALANAQSTFMADTSKDAFDKLITLARQNLSYRQNALGQGPAGSADNRYNFSGNSGTPAAAAPPAPGGVVDYKTYFGGQ